MSYRNLCRVCGVEFLSQLMHDGPPICSIYCAWTFVRDVEEDG